MKIWSHSRSHKSSFIPLVSKLLLAAVVAFISLSSPAQEQPAPSIIWQTGALVPVIAVDSQTNIYCSSLGAVVTLAPNGTILGTNNMCPAPGLCQRDSSGNFYFAGTYSPPVNFGVTNLTNNNCFIAKYNSNGVCLWAQAFSTSNILNDAIILDLQLDPQGNAYAAVGVVYEEDQFHQTSLYKFNPSGSNVWSAGVPIASVPSQFEISQAIPRIGGLTTSNGYVFDFASVSDFPIGTLVFAAFSEFNTSSGGMAQYSSFNFSGSVPAALRPVGDSSGNVFDVESGRLMKRNSTGAAIWSNSISGNHPFTISADLLGGVYVGDQSSGLYHYDLAGNLIWSTSLPAVVNGFVSDSSGDRFFSVTNPASTNGSIYSISPDVLSAPAITAQPVGQTVMVGSNVSFSVTATGSTPFYYFWQQNSNPVPGGVNATLSLTNVTTNQAGSYSVIVSNFIGTTNSASAQLRVKNVELFVGSQLLTNGTYYFSNTPTFTIVSEFTNGSAFYTLNGSTPSFLSTAYIGPFSISNNATIQAIGYSADFSQSEFADTVIAYPPAIYSLSATTAGGGTVGLNPPGGVYNSTNIVTATATPAAGFTFLYWTGAVSSENPVINLTLSTNESIQAVFGTTLSNTVAGNGQVFIYPSGPLYPYGSIVRLSAVPQTNYCFGVWGNAATGTTNPLFYTITNANPVVSAAFAAIPGGDAALTVLISGGGQVNVNPSGNYFPLDQSITLTATPNAGKTFLGWSGSATGTNNPLNISLTQSEVITANFNGAVSLFLNRPSGDGYSAQGFLLTVTSDMQNVFQIQSSSNLVTWQNAGTVTNTGSQVQFTDPSATNSPKKFYQLVPPP